MSEKKKKHSITITVTQVTDGEVDNATVVEEFSDSSTIHVIKTKVFTDEVTKAVNAATQRLGDMALEALGGK